MEQQTPKHEERSEMEQQDSKRLGYIERKIDDLRIVTADISYSFNELSSHLFGSKKLDSTDGGIVGRIQIDITILMKGHDEIKFQINSNEKKQEKYNIQTKIMWGAIGTAIGGVAMAIFSLWISKH